VMVSITTVLTNPGRKPSGCAQAAEKFGDTAELTLRVSPPDLRFRIAEHGSDELFLGQVGMPRSS
jgi:hypothetical protein